MMLKKCNEAVLPSPNWRYMDDQEDYSLEEKGGAAGDRRAEDLGLSHKKEGEGV